MKHRPIPKVVEEGAPVSYGATVAERNPGPWTSRQLLISLKSFVARQCTFKGSMKWLPPHSTPLLHAIECILDFS